MGMCRWMGSPFHDWFDYNGVAFSIELPAWGRTFSDFRGKIGLHIYGYLWLANVQECLYCRWNVNCSSFNLKNGSIHFRIIFRIRLRYINRKWLGWDRQNYFCPKVTKMGSEIRHTIDSNVVFPAAVFWMSRNGPVAWHQKTAARETNYNGVGAKIHPSAPRVFYSLLPFLSTLLPGERISHRTENFKTVVYSIQTCKGSVKQHRSGILLKFRT